ncbi:mRNA surveillance protein pelota [Candidatus Woesearchaeota archaeon]|nr:mRNA surveillance protein pelota [Candidatus Woesearchaeota archaeon]
MFDSFDYGNKINNFIYKSFSFIVMKILSSDLRKGFAKLKVESLDDLWYLNQIISKGDLVKGKTFRKIRIGGKEERSQKVVKKPVFIEIETEKLDYTGDLLRVSGKIRQGPEDVPRGSYHTFTIEEGSQITVKKESWLTFQVKRLKEASAAKGPTILLCILDREESILALLKGYKSEILSTLKGKVAKKALDDEGKHTFYGEIIAKIKEYVSRYSPVNIILASPAFWKEDLMKEMKDEDLRKKVVLATCSSVSTNAISEVLKRQEVREVLRQDMVANELKLVEQLLTEVSKDGNVVYGIKETGHAAAAGAVEKLMVTDGLIHRLREKDEYDQLEELMKLADQTKAEVHIISSEHEGGKELDGLGGIGAILRYKLKY